MPAQTIFFVGDKFHASQTAASVHSVSSTESGYNRESVRDTSWLDAWKPVNGVADEYIQIDGGSAGWLGTTGGDTIHVAVAYDGRGAQQTQLQLATDSADAAAGTFLQNKSLFTVNNTGPTVDYSTYLLPAAGKRYYRLWQSNAARGGGTKTVPIYAIAFFTAAEVYILDTEYPQAPPGPGDYLLGSNVGMGETAGGMLQTNRNGPPYQEVDVNIDRATQALWDAITSHFMTWHDGPNRAIWLQYEGLYNPALDNFAMVYQSGFQSRRPQKDLYDTRLRFRTCGKPI